MVARICRLAILFAGGFVAMLAGVPAQAADGSSQSDSAPPAASPTQSASAQATSPPPSNSLSEQLQQIVVTAQRREQNIQNVPISITALSQAALNNLHVQDLSDLESVTPGLVFTTPTSFNPNGTSDIAIRGIFSGGAGSAPTTQVYIDDTPIEEDIVGVAGVFSNPNPEIFDLQRVEVLRGPQGTLFGASAMGGAIRFITPQPSLTETSGYAQGEMAYSPYGAPSYNLGLAYGAPLVNDVVGFRISAYYNDTGGYINQENPFTGERLGNNVNYQTSYSLRPALTIAPLAGLTITLSEFLQNLDLENPPIYWLTELPVPKPGGQEAEGLTQPQPTTDYLSIPSLTITYDLPALTIESNTSSIYRRFFFNENMTNADQFFTDGLDFTPGVPPSDSWFWQNFAWTTAVQEELRFTSKDEPGKPFHWTFGLYYNDTHQLSSQVLPGNLDDITEACCHETETQIYGFGQYVDSYGQSDNGYTDYNNSQREEAAYLNISYDFTPRLNVAVGARYSHDTVTSNQFISGALNAHAPPWVRVYLPAVTQNPVTPRFSASYHVAADTMVYTTIAEGFRLGGTQPTSFINSPACQPSLRELPGVFPSSTYGSDSLWSYELGAKSTLLDNRLTVDASAYHIDWSNIQTDIPVASCLFGFIANFGKAYSNGGDIQLRAALSDSLTLGVSGGYTDAYYGKSEIIGQALLAQSGERLPNVPPWSVAANAEYQRALPFWSEANGYVRIDFRHISAMPQLDPAIATYDPAVGPYQDAAYSTLNLRMGVLYGRLDASVFVNNATNANPLLGYSHWGPGDALFMATQIPPLTAGITARYRF